MFNNLNLSINDSFLGSNSSTKTVASSFDYNSFYRAIVKSNYDPENLGRVRICIPALHSNVTSINQYPYAYPGIFVGLGNQTGQFILPPVGSIVFVTFEYSSEHRPIYFGGIPTLYAEGKSQSYGYRVLEGLEKQVSDNDIPTEYNGSQAIIYKSPSGSIIYMDDFSYDQRVVIQDSVGQEICMETWPDNDGELHKTLTIKTDDNNSVTLEPDYLKVKLSGYEYVFTKDNLSGGGSGGGSDCQLVIWE